MKPGAIFFDMDGVLVDVSRSFRRVIEETAAHFTGRDVEPGTVQRYKNMGGFNDDWKLTHAIISDAGMDVPLSRVIEEFQKRYRGESWNGFIVTEPALMKTETLERLCTADRVMGVITGRPEAEAYWTVERFGWKKFFPLLIGMEKQEGRGKPDPYCLNLALTILEAAGRKIEAGCSVYVGDSVDDMVAARAAGMWAIGVVPPYLDGRGHADLLRQRGAHLVLNDVNELPEVVDRIEELADTKAPVGRP